MPNPLPFSSSTWRCNAFTFRVAPKESVNVPEHLIVLGGLEDMLGASLDKNQVCTVQMCLYVNTCSLQLPNVFSV
jgi:hypothetical protein